MLVFLSAGTSVWQFPAVNCQCLEVSILHRHQLALVLATFAAAVLSSIRRKKGCVAAFDIVDLIIIYFSTTVITHSNYGQCLVQHSLLTVVANCHYNPTRNSTKLNAATVVATSISKGHWQSSWHMSQFGIWMQMVQNCVCQHTLAHMLGVSGTSLMLPGWPVPELVLILSSWGQTLQVLCFAVCRLALHSAAPCLHLVSALSSMMPLVQVQQLLRRCKSQAELRHDSSQQSCVWHLGSDTWVLKLSCIAWAINISVHT